MTANLRAKARNPGRCAMAGCRMAGDKIYEGDGLKLLACSEGHANVVLAKIARAVGETGATLEQRNAALRLFNERLVEPVCDSEDDYDISF